MASRGDALTIQNSLVVRVTGPVFGWGLFSSRSFLPVSNSKNFLTLGKTEVLLLSVTDSLGVCR